MKKRELNIIKKFFEVLFPKSISQARRDSIFNMLIHQLYKKGIIRIKKSKMILGEKMDEDKVIEEITNIVKNMFCY